MVTITGSFTITNDGIASMVWTGMATNDVGKGAASGRFADKSVAAYGTFGTGGTIVIEGSWDGGTTWAVLHDPQGVAIALISADPVSVIAESPPLIRPRVSAGTGVTLSCEISAPARGA